MRDISFIRWGNIKPSKQKGFGSDTFHSPPAKKGLYAFPEGFVETFLLGGFQFRPDRHTWVKKEDGSLISYDDPEKEKYEIRYKFSFKDKLYQRAYIGNKYDWVKKTKLDPYHQFNGNNNAQSNNTNEADNKLYLAKIKPSKKFKHYGNVWTHLQPRKAKDILDVYQSWYLVEYYTLVKSLQIRYATNQTFKATEGYPYTKDDCEVFIEKIISKNTNKKGIL